METQNSSISPLYFITQNNTVFKRWFISFRFIINYKNNSIFLLKQVS